MPLDLGIDKHDLIHWSATSAQAPPANGLVNLAPNIILAGTPLQQAGAAARVYCLRVLAFRVYRDPLFWQVHMQFSLLGIERAYVTFGGRLHGVIRRSNLHERGEGEQKKK